MPAFQDDVMILLVEHLNAQFIVKASRTAARWSG